MKSEKQQLKIENILNFKLLFLALSFTFLVFATQVANAAEVYFISSSQNFYKDDTFIVEARIGSSEEEINVIDGSFSFNKNVLKVKELSTGGSVFSLWAQQPSFSNDEGTIIFVGGVPEGFQGENGLILKVIFLGTNEGNSDVSFGDNTEIFLSDGKGTRTTLTKKPLTISILPTPKDIAPKDEWLASKEEDKTSPKFVEAIISKDARIFDNKYFVSFFAVDTGSGIAYYEIKEGDTDFRRAESPHILSDQTLQTNITIKATDNAGNEQIISPEVGPEPAAPSLNYLFWIIGLLFLLFVAFMIKRFMNAKI